MRSGRSVLWVVGVGFVALVVAAIFALAYYVPRVVQAGRQFMAEEQGRGRVVAGWSAPGSAADPERWFPAQLDTWRRVSTDPRGRWRDFPADRVGVGATYDRDGRKAVVLAFPVTPLEAEALEARVTSAWNRGGGTRTQVVTPVRMLFEQASPAQRLEVWRVPGWWILFHSPETRGSLDGLPEAFFRAVPPGRE